MFFGDLRVPWEVLFIIYEVWGSPGSKRSQNGVKNRKKRTRIAGQAFGTNASRRVALVQNASLGLALRTKRHSPSGVGPCPSGVGPCLSNSSMARRSTQIFEALRGFRAQHFMHTWSKIMKIHAYIEHKDVWLHTSLHAYIKCTYIVE